MDAFSASLLLGVAAGTGNADRVADLAKSLRGDGPTDDVAVQVTAMIGKRCEIKYTSYKGTVVGPNTARGGFYGGERFPVLVRVDKTCDGSEGSVFEYSLEQVILI